MWIFCGGMYRSGSTLQYQIISEIVELKEIGKRITWEKPEMFSVVRGKYETYAKIKVFKSHICTSDIRAEFEINNAWGAYIYRDLRDVIVSIMQKRGFSFEDVIKGDVIKSCIDNYYAWRALPKVYVSRYEEVVEDLKSEVFGIADFFKINLSRSETDIITTKLSLPNQKERIKQFKKMRSYVNLRKNRFDPFSLLHMDHIQDGRVSKWKEVLTASQARVANLKYGEWLKKNHYDL